MKSLLAELNMRYFNSANGLYRCNINLLYFAETKQESAETYFFVTEMKQYLVDSRKDFIYEKNTSVYKFKSTFHTGLSSPHNHKTRLL